MFIRQEKDYMVPVRHIKINDLGLQEEEFIPREMTTNMNNVKAVVQKKVQYLFFKVRDLSKVVSREDLYTLFEGLFKTIWLLHVNNVPCFQVIKEKNIKGMNEEELLAFHLGKFKKMYDFHFEAFKCSEDRKKRKVLRSKELDTKIKMISNEIEMTFNEIADKTSGMTTKDILRLHLFMLQNIMKLLVENVPCFEKAKNGINNMTLEEKIKMHSMDFTKVFDMHIKLLNCK